MSEPVISLDADDAVPPFQQIVDQIRAAIERGDLAAGIALPTVRQLADDLGIAPNTVARAYADLQENHWIVSEGRRGTRVAGAPPSRNKDLRAGALTEAVRRFIDTLGRRGYTSAEIRDELRRHI